MGPLRFELRSEDPQSPRMSRLPYGPRFNNTFSPYIVSAVSYSNEAALLSRFNMSNGSFLRPLKDAIVPAARPLRS